MRLIGLQVLVAYAAAESSGTVVSVAQVANLLGTRCDTVERWLAHAIGYGLLSPLERYTVYGPGHHPRVGVWKYALTPAGRCFLRTTSLTGYAAERNYQVACVP